MPFLKELMCEDKEGYHCVLTNSVVDHLINNEGLLRKMPIEWKTGFSIADSLLSGSGKIEDVSKKFYEHGRSGLACRQ